MHERFFDLDRYEVNGGLAGSAREHTVVHAGSRLVRAVTSEARIIGDDEPVPCDKIGEQHAFDLETLAPEAEATLPRLIALD